MAKKYSIVYICIQIYTMDLCSSARQRRRWRSQSHFAGPPSSRPLPGLVYTRSKALLVVHLLWEVRRGWTEGRYSLSEGCDSGGYIAPTTKYPTRVSAFESHIQMKATASHGQISNFTTTPKSWLSSRSKSYIQQTSIQPTWSARML